MIFDFHLAISEIYRFKDQTIEKEEEVVALNYAQYFDKRDRMLLLNLKLQHCNGDRKQNQCRLNSLNKSRSHFLIKRSMQTFDLGV